MQPQKISVVIPYFQRAPGILSRALASIAAQTYPTSAISVVIVDDGSPRTANAELAEYPAPLGLSVRIINQENAGPNEARNTGLESLPTDTDFVAYLDSDDEWVEDHLSRAVSALQGNQNVYFANLYHLRDKVAEFEKARRVAPSEHPMQGTDETIRIYNGDMLHQINTANIIFMPSLVIRFRDLGSVRFPKAHRHGGGDYLYWMALVSAGASFVFSTKPEVHCGAGINMWYANGWGTDGYARRITDEARFRRTALNTYVTSNQTRVSLESRIQTLQTEFVRDLLHRIRRRKVIDWTLVRTFFGENPLSIRGLYSILHKLFSQ